MVLTAKRRTSTPSVLPLRRRDGIMVLQHPQRLGLHVQGRQLPCCIQPQRGVGVRRAQRGLELVRGEEERVGERIVGGAELSAGLGGDKQGGAGWALTQHIFFYIQQLQKRTFKKMYRIFFYLA